MLYLLLQLGNDRYAIGAAEIREVIPLVRVKGLPGAPRGIAGLVDYHGEPLPLIDLSEIVLGVPTAPRMAARIVVWHGTRSAATRLLGLLVPRATELLRCAEEDFVNAPVEVADARYLGNVVTDRRGLIQRIHVTGLLSEDVRRAVLRSRDAA